MDFKCALIARGNNVFFKRINQMDSESYFITKQGNQLEFTLLVYRPVRMCVKEIERYLPRGSLVFLK